MKWRDAQKWEAEWHGSCINTYREQIKQEVYIEKLQLEVDYPNYDLLGQKILDLGAGDCSILLRFNNKKGTASDPLLGKFPKWVTERYIENDILPIPYKGEEMVELSLDGEGYDEVWIYNVLQHTDDPELVISNARRMGKLIRIFEWIEEPLSDGHIHVLHEKDLNKWLGGQGRAEMINDRGAHGLCYHGVFLGGFRE
jgi:2-polyprenyl-3-methyl-5-hydroxy-6-metoxy-1,4-benzoquinol methylase